MAPMGMRTVSRAEGSASSVTLTRATAATLFGCPVYRTYSAKIVSGDFEAGFTMNLGLKDLTLAAAAAANTGRTLPVLDAVRARMAEAVDSGMGDRDWPALADYTLHRGHGMIGRSDRLAGS
jgi:3-hydroxyisobutyrate dehydrogenase-like beta-hydroxyacid dehydrogenase